MSNVKQMGLTLVDTSPADKVSVNSALGNNAAIENPVILTPNASLAQQLRRHRLLQQDSRSAPAANIHVLQRWITDSITPELPLASEVQLRYLWEQVITEQRDQNQDFQQLNPGFLAGQALTAWRNLKHWQIGLDELTKAETGQLLSFKKWVVDFEKRLAKQKLGTLELELIKQLALPAQDRQPLVQTYAFIEALAPLWQQWLTRKFETIEQIDYSSQNTGNNEPLLCALESGDQELDAAMHWAKSILQSSKGSSQAHIAIIDVSLKGNLKVTRRRAESVFNTEALQSQVRFSQETALASSGCVQTILRLLSLNKRQIDLATARQICHSPLWSMQGSYQDEYAERAQWDFDLCALQSAELNTSDFLSLVQISNHQKEPGSHSNQSSASKLAAIFSDRHRHKPQSPLEWCDIFQEQLSQLHCFEHFTNSEWQRWIDALGDFAKLGSVAGDIGIAEALQQLEHCCSASSPKISSSAPGVTFMDTVEAAADYTHIWMLGMDNMSWPGAPRLNPLLPVSLQIQRQMPHSQPQMEAGLSKRLIERLVLAADQVVFSYCQFNDDLEQSPCAFVADFSEHTSQHRPEAPSKSEEEKPELEWVDCSSAPIVPDEQKAVRGGASLLKTMAASPFDAFAQWRLGAYQLDSPKIGLSALDRGNLVHNVLERIWNELSGSRKLSELDKNSTSELCRTVAEKELKRFQARNGWLKQRFAELEVKRLANLVADWLNFERERSGFSVELTEENLTADIAGLTFKMRLDRLDRLSDGRLVLIDYKTGQSLSRNFWLKMPPVEPQLPLYALTLDTAPDALCFAKVRADKMEFIGIGAEAVEDTEGTMIKGIQSQDNWAGLMAEWKESLETLASNYINGDTRAFETVAGFGRTDPFAALHRFAEFDQMEELKARFLALNSDADVNE